MLENKKLWLLLDNKEYISGNVVEAKNKKEAIDKFKKCYPFHNNINYITVNEIKINDTEEESATEFIDILKDFVRTEIEQYENEKAQNLVSALINDLEKRMNDCFKKQDKPNIYINF